MGKVLIATKCDLTNKRVVSYDRGKALADEFHIPFFETSAKERAGVEEPFMAIAREVKKSGGWPAIEGEKKKESKKKKERKKERKDVEEEEEAKKTIRGKMKKNHGDAASQEKRHRGGKKERKKEK